MCRPNFLMNTQFGPTTKKVAGRKFLLRSEVCFVTWSQSHFDDYEEFYGGLLKVMPPGTKMFGCQEFHGDGRPHYHVVLRFPFRVHWSDATKYFMVKRVDGQVDTRAIRITVPAKGEVVEEFLQRTQAYCAKEGNGRVFGRRFGETVMPSCVKCRSRVSGDDGCFCVSCVDGAWRERVSFTRCLSFLSYVFFSVRLVLLTGFVCPQIKELWVMNGRLKVEVSSYRKRMLRIRRLCSELSEVVGDTECLVV